MRFVIFVLSIIICVKTVSYGIYELNNNKNKFGGLFVITIAFVSTILPNLVVYFIGI